MYLGARVRAERKRLKLSQEALARRADVSMNVVARLERGVINDPHVTTLSAVAAALGVPVSTLLGEESAPLVQAPSTSPDKDEERRATGLSHWIEHIDVRARTWEQRAKDEENPYLIDWRVAVRWEEDVAEEALKLFEAAEGVASALVGGGAEGEDVEALQRLEGAYNRLWSAKRVVGKQVGKVLDSFIDQLKAQHKDEDVIDIEQARKERDKREEREEKRLKLQRRTG